MVASGFSKTFLIPLLALLLLILLLAVPPGHEAYAQTGSESWAVVVGVRVVVSSMVFSRMGV